MSRTPATLLFVAAAGLLALATIKAWGDFGETFEGIFLVVGIVFATLAVALVAVGTWLLRRR
jgi:hypothetical protein